MWPFFSPCVPEPAQSLGPECDARLHTSTVHCSFAPPFARHLVQSSPPLDSLAVSVLPTSFSVSADLLSRSSAAIWPRDVPNRLLAMPRVCDLCGAAYLGAGQCADATCPRNFHRRKFLFGTLGHQRHAVDGRRLAPAAAADPQPPTTAEASAGTGEESQSETPGESQPPAGAQAGAQSSAAADTQQPMAPSSSHESPPPRSEHADASGSHEEGRSECAQDAHEQGESDSSPVVLPECVVCWASPRDTIILPCGHICLCGACAHCLAWMEVPAACPMCRCPVLSMRQVYL